MSITITLPEPPSANRLWRLGRGRAYKSDAAHTFALAVRVACLAAGVRTVRYREGVAVRVTMHWYRARKVGDLDNRAKATLDALTGLVYDDDKQVSELHIHRIDGQRPGRCVVTVERAA